MGPESSVTEASKKAKAAPVARKIVASQPLIGSQFDLFRSELFKIKSNLAEDEPSMQLVGLLDQLNTQSQTRFDEGQVLATLMLMSEENMGVWYQEELETLMFI
jgi:hypothetical protein